MAMMALLRALSLLFIHDDKSFSVILSSLGVRAARREMQIRIFPRELAGLPPSQSLSDAADTHCSTAEVMLVGE